MDSENVKTGTVSSGIIGKYVPPKDWDALTSDEKIERMREQVKVLQNQVGGMSTSIHSLRMKLKSHEHREGKVFEMKEIKDYDDSHGLGEVAYLSNPKYF